MPKYCVFATITVGTETHVIASDEEELYNNLCYGLGFEMTNVSVKEED